MKEDADAQTVNLLLIAKPTPAILRVNLAQPFRGMSINRTLAILSVVSICASIIIAALIVRDGMKRIGVRPNELVIEEVIIKHTAVDGPQSSDAIAPRYRLQIDNMRIDALPQPPDDE